MQDDNNYAPSYNPDWDDPVFADGGDALPTAQPAKAEALPVPLPPARPERWDVVERDEADAPPFDFEDEEVAACEAASTVTPPATFCEPDAPAAAMEGAPVAGSAAPVAWPKRDFGVPALLCRSAIFSAGPGKGQQPKPSRAVACYAPYSASLEGPRLTMADKAVWEQVALAAWKRGRSDQPFPISLGAIHKAVTGSQWSPSADESDRIVERLRRLTKAKVSFARKDVSGSAPLLAELIHVEGPPGKRGRWLARMDAAWAPLFAVDTLCEPLAASMRPSTELGKWLRDFFGSNEAYRYTAGRLRELSGFEGPRDKFGGALRAALADLSENCPKLLAKCDLDDKAVDSSDWTVDVARAAANQVKASPADGKEKSRAAAEAATKAARSERPASTTDSDGRRQKRQSVPKRRGGVAL